MTIIEYPREALKIYDQEITVYPTYNALHNNTDNGWGEPISLTRAMIISDPQAVTYAEPVVPKDKSGSQTINVDVDGAGSNEPNTLMWISVHQYPRGTYVQTGDHFYQIDSIEDHRAITGLFVYQLKGDDSLEPE